MCCLVLWSIILVAIWNWCESNFSHNLYWMYIACMVWSIFYLYSNMSILNKKMAREDIVKIWGKITQAIIIVFGIKVNYEGDNLWQWQLLLNLAGLLAFRWSIYLYLLYGERDLILLKGLYIMVYLLCETIKHKLDSQGFSGCNNSFVFDVYISGS